MRELLLTKCNNCNALIKVINDCNCKCSFVCCDEIMETVNANSTDASVEKHKPIVKVENNKIKVKVDHVMESDHYIEWICVLNDKEEKYIYLDSSDIAEVEFDYVDNATVYSYCNKHGLWKTTIE